MVNGSDVRRPSRIWWAGFLSLAVCLGVGNGALRAQERLLAAAAGFPDADVAPALADVAVRPGGPLDEGLAGVGARLDELSRLVGKVRAGQDELAAVKEHNQQLLARIEVLEADRGRLPDALKQAKELARASKAANAKVRGLAEALIDERRQNARLSADLAEANAERAKAAEAARARVAALAAWMDGLRDELAEREAAVALATEQRAAMQDQLRARDRQMAAARIETAELRYRLDIAQADNDRLAAELAATRRAADFATTMARAQLTTIEDQIELLHGAAGTDPPARPEQPAALLSASLGEVLPALPYPKPRPAAGALDARAPAAANADDGTPAPAETIPAIEDGVWVPAGFRDPAVDDWQPTPAHAAAAIPDGPEIVDIMSIAALDQDPSASDPTAWGEGDAAHESPPPSEWRDRTGLMAAAARLADGLAATRNEAMSQREERVFTVDVEERAFAAAPATAPVPLDPALDIHLFTAKSELAGAGRGGIRFFPDGSSTGGRIELELLGERAAVNVRWSTGGVTVER